MGIYYIIFIGIALAMDAFGVSIGLGLNQKLDYKSKLKFIASFSAFQFMFSYLGGILGRLFQIYVTSIPNIIGGVVMNIVGILMILDGIKEKETDIVLKNSTCLILGISVSIDALVIGFTNFSIIGSIIILLSDSIIIGIITSLFCSIAFFLGNYIKRLSFVEKYSNMLGGIALIIFGMRMIIF